MTDKDFENMHVYRKAERCAVLYELLCEELGLNPLEPTTTWKDIVKGYATTMAEAYKLQKQEDENTNS